MGDRHGQHGGAAEGDRGEHGGPEREERERAHRGHGEAEVKPRLAERHGHAPDGDRHEGPRDLREVEPSGCLSRRGVRCMSVSAVLFKSVFFMYSCSRHACIDIEPAEVPSSILYFEEKIWSGAPMGLSLSLCRLVLASEKTRGQAQLLDTP